MNSNELPITEWWDPECDAYDVPLCPQGDWENPAKPELYDAWWAAYQHLWNLRWVMSGSAEYRPDFKGRELTRHAYPGQPSTRALHVVQPCRCEYVQWFARDTFTGYLDALAQRIRPVATGFRIAPHCPHHGHLAHTNLIERMWESPYEYGVLRDPFDMDDDERRH